jgi:hypothetical protein
MSAETAEFQRILESFKKSSAPEFIASGPAFSLAGVILPGCNPLISLNWKPSDTTRAAAVGLRLFHFFSISIFIGLILLANSYLILVELEIFTDKHHLWPGC